MTVLSGGGLRKVSGNVANLGGIGPAGRYAPTSSPASAGGSSVKDSGRNRTVSHQYPLDVDTAQSQGHYIIFEILQQDKAKLATLANVKTAAGKMAEIKKQQGNADSISPPPKSNPGDRSASDGTAVSAAANLYAAAKSKKQSGPNSIAVAKAATTAMKGCIALYMPPAVQVSYGANYGDADIGLMAESVNAGIQAFMNTGGSMGDRIATGIGTGAGGLISGGINKLKTMLPAGGEAILAINTGSIITPRMELMFEGIQRRTFSFSFTFIPKSAPEAEKVEQIVKLFKKHMSSNYGSNGMGGVDGVREMEIPDFFNIEYMYRGNRNTHLNRIKQCVLTKADIDYGSDRWHAFENGQPQTTKLALSFSELEIITKDYIEQGY